MPARGQRRERHTATDVRGADALRSVELVRRQRQRVDPQRVDGDLQLAGCLHGVGVEQGAGVVRHARERRDVIDVAQLVVGERQRDQRRIRPERGAERVGGDAAIGIDGDIGDVGILGGERGQDGRVLEAGGDHVRAAPLPDPFHAAASRGEGDGARGAGDAAEEAADGEIVRFRAARREDDLLGVRRRPGARRRRRASSTAARAARPDACVLDGLPGSARNAAAIASATSGRTGVVALWSR